MSREVRKYTVTVPAGTAIATPATTSIAFPVRTVRTVEWRVPPGSLGVMGWQLAMGGVQVVPFGSDTWVIADSTSGSFTLDGYPDSGAWQVIAYNTGAFAHAVFLTFHLDLVEQPRPVPQQLAGPLTSSLFDLSKSGPPVRRSR